MGGIVTGGGKHDCTTHRVGWRLSQVLQFHLFFCNVTKFGLTRDVGGGEEKRERRKRKRRKRRRGWEEERRRGEEERRGGRRGDRKEFHLGRNAISVACPTTLPIHQLSLYVCRGQSTSHYFVQSEREKKKKYRHQVNSEVGSPWT